MTTQDYDVNLDIPEFLRRTDKPAKPLVARRRDRVPVLAWTRKPKDENGKPIKKRRKRRRKAKPILPRTIDAAGLALYREIEATKKGGGK